MGKRKRKHDEDNEAATFRPEEETTLVPRTEPASELYFSDDDDTEGDPVIYALVPPDLTQCQCEWPDPAQETFGPRPRQRCEQAPTVVAFQRRRTDDSSPTGAMSLCDDHRVMLEHMFPRQLYYRTITSDKKIGSVV